MQTKETTTTGITEMEITWMVISREEEGQNRGNVQGIRSINDRYKIGKGSIE